MRSRNKAQLTLYAIIGLLMVVVLAVLFFALSSSSPPSVEPALDDNAPQFEHYVTTCLEQSTDQALEILSRSGGGYGDSEFMYYDKLNPIHYFSYGGQMIAPSKQEIEQRLGLVIDVQVSHCLGHYEPFTDQGWTPQAEPATSTVVLREDSAAVLLHLPLVFERQGAIVEFSDFETTASTPFLSHYTQAQELATLLAGDPSRICVSCLDAHAHVYDVRIEAISYTPDTTVVSIVDGDYVFRFAHYNKNEQ